MSLQLAELNELCPSCGEFVSELYDATGFCYPCSGVGVSENGTPTSSEKQIRIESWLRDNADKIESLMLTNNLPAKDAIKLVAGLDKPTCKCCGDEMPHTTAGRHFFCTKKDKCRKARRYYRYLIYEKGINKTEALERSIERFS